MRTSNTARYRPGWDRGNVLLTPAYILEPIRAALRGIGLDPCTEPDNPTRADRFVSLPDDGLAIDWRASSVYVNPPYGAARLPWIRRSLEVGQAGGRLALLIPADTDTELVQAVLRGAEAVTFIRGRINFGGWRDDGKPWRATHASMLATWNADLGPLEAIGATVRP